METDFRGAVDPEGVLALAHAELKLAIANCIKFRDPYSLLVESQRIWNNLTLEEKVNSKIEEKLKVMWTSTSQVLGSVDSSNGDPIRGRINPYKWTEFMPQDYKGIEDVYILDRAKNLLEFVEGITF